MKLCHDFTNTRCMEMTRVHECFCKNNLYCELLFKLFLEKVAHSFVIRLLSLFKYIKIQDNRYKENSCLERILLKKAFFFNF